MDGGKEEERGGSQGQIARVPSGGTGTGRGSALASPYGAASSHRSPGPARSRTLDDTANTLDAFQQIHEPKQHTDSPRSASSKRSVLSQVARKPRAFHPHSEFRVMLDLAYFFAGFYTIFAALYLVCFQIEAPPGPFLVASGLADAAFIADLLFNLNTGFVRVEKGVTEVVLEVLPAMLHYMRNGLLMDMVISLPVIVIQYSYFYFFGSDPSREVTLTLRILHMFKTLCALRMRKIFEKFRTNNPGRNFQVSLASNITFIVATAHLIACVWMVFAAAGYSEPSTAFSKIYATGDVDECAAKSHNCDVPRATCTNTAGSFTCTCLHGLIGNGTECYECPEYSSTFTRMTCRLYGEALAEPIVYTPPTMEMIESGKYVNDEDECINGSHNCDPQAKCINTPGLDGSTSACPCSFQCDCRLGYEGSGVQCHACNDPDTVLKYMDLYQQYSCALYFSLSIGLRVGDGYVETKSSSERILFVFAMCALVCLVSYMASRFALASSATFEPYTQFLLDRRKMSQYFVERGMAKSANRADAERCFDHHWEKQKSVPRQEPATLQLLQSPARVTVFRSLHEQAFSSVQFFGDKRRDNIFWEFIMQNAQVVIHGDGDVISIKGEMEDALYAIKSGYVKEVNEEGKAVRAMKRPCHWGEGALLKAVANSLRYAQVNIVAKGMAEVFMISSGALEHLVQRDAEVNKLCMDFIHDEMERYISLKYNVISKRLCAWAVEKAQIEFRNYNMGRDDLRPRAYGRLR